MTRTTGENTGLQSTTRINSTERSNIYGFYDGKQKVSNQGQGSVVYCTVDLDSHADTIFCCSNCIVMHFMGKECDVAPYTDAYNIIKAVTISQASTTYNNTETGETTILILIKPN